MCVCLELTNVLEMQRVLLYLTDVPGYCLLEPVLVRLQYKWEEVKVEARFCGHNGKVPMHSVLRILEGHVMQSLP